MNLVWYLCVVHLVVTSCSLLNLYEPGVVTVCGIPCAVVHFLLTIRRLHVRERLTGTWKTASSDARSDYTVVRCIRRSAYQDRPCLYLVA